MSQHSQFEMNENILKDLHGNIMRSLEEKENCTKNENVKGKYNQSRPFVVSIEGNIGSGKSTMINYFKDFKDIQIHPEPVGKWQDCNGENLLEKLYTNPQRWSFQFQSYIQLTRLQELKAPMKDSANVRLLERSIQSNKYCFIELAKNNKDLCKEEASVLEKWFDWMDNHMSLELDLIVYLRTDPEVAYDRMLQRGRSEETGSSGPPLEYLKILHKAHEDWLMKQKFGALKPKIIVFDANQDLSHMRSHYEEFQDQIRGMTADGLDVCVKPFSITPNR